MDTTYLLLLVKQICGEITLSVFLKSVAVRARATTATLPQPRSGRIENRKAIAHENIEKDRRRPRPRRRSPRRRRPRPRRRPRRRRPRCLRVAWALRGRCVGVARALRGPTPPHGTHHVRPQRSHMPSLRRCIAVSRRSRAAAFAPPYIALPPLPSPTAPSTRARCERVAWQALRVRARRACTGRS